MCRLAFIPIACFSLAISSPVLALQARSVFAGDAAQGVDLKVWTGYGLTIDFLPTHALIKKAWLGHPGRFVLSSDGNLCPQLIAQEQSCTDTDARVIFLRAIQQFKIPGLPPSVDGATQLTLIVQEPSGEQRQYQFGLRPAQGKPDYTSLVIRPDSEKRSPFQLQLTAPRLPIPKRVPLVTSESVSANNNPQQSVNEPKVSISVIPPATTQMQATSEPSRQSLPNLPQQRQLPLSTDIAPNAASQSLAAAIDDANAAAFGLLVANQKGQIKPRTAVWNRAQNAIRWLRRGESREDAARKAGLDRIVLVQLIAWGQNRP